MLLVQGLANRKLRDWVREAGVADAGGYRSQDLRRGHADDIRRHGGSKGDIYLAGTWKPGGRGPFAYLDIGEVEMEAVHEAADPWSSDSEGESAVQ